MKPKKKINRRKFIETAAATTDHNIHSSPARAWRERAISPLQTKSRLPILVVAPKD